MPGGILSLPLGKECGEGEDNAAITTTNGILFPLKLVSGLIDSRLYISLCSFQWQWHIFPPGVETVMILVGVTNYNKDASGALTWLRNGWSCGISIWSTFYKFGVLIRHNERPTYAVFMGSSNILELPIGAFISSKVSIGAFHSPFGRYIGWLVLHDLKHKMLSEVGKVLGSSCMVVTSWAFVIIIKFNEFYFDLNVWLVVELKDPRWHYLAKMRCLGWSFIFSLSFSLTVGMHGCHLFGLILVVCVGYPHFCLFSHGLF